MPRAVCLCLVPLLALVALPAPAAVGAEPLLLDPDPGVDHRGELTDLERGNGGYWVRLLQERLNEAGFRAGGVDGRFGRQTLAAVYAFQKHWRLDRTGVFRTEDWRLLDLPLLSPGRAPEASRIEIDLAKQILYLIEGNAVEVIPVSSGNGESYRNGAGRLVRATTPEGRFSFHRTRGGWWRSYLGWMYRPHYFRVGYAVHGSSSVPPYPASHGCVRVEISDMDYLVTRFELGMPVYVYGHRVTRGEVVPEIATSPPIQTSEIA